MAFVAELVVAELIAVTMTTKIRFWVWVATDDWRVDSRVGRERQ